MWFSSLILPSSGAKRPRRRARPHERAKTQTEECLLFTDGVLQEHVGIFSGKQQMMMIRIPFYSFVFILLMYFIYLYFQCDDDVDDDEDYLQLILY